LWIRRALILIMHTLKPIIPYIVGVFFLLCFFIGFTVVGYALYFYTYSTWKGRSIFLEDLYVMPEFRGNGIGKGFSTVFSDQVGKKKECVRLQLSVLDWNTPSRDFYAAKGAQDLTVSEGWHAIRFDGPSLDNLAKEAAKI
uniref:Spermidine/spermine N1-acetyltransferase family member 2b n=1 Tax=Oryzias sinensis TaxID=183150 RepID=A0A8C8E4C9_9TELE